MTIHENCRMTYLTKIGEKYDGGHADNCTVRMDADDIRVEARYNPDNKTGTPDEVWQGKKDAQGVFRLTRADEGTWATLCHIDDRLIGDWHDKGTFGLWKLDLGE